MTGFWIFMLICNLLIPAIMLIFGLRFSQKAPKQINCFFGYRTTLSMKNRDTWDFAHSHCGRLWFRIGVIMLPLSVILMIFFIGCDIQTIGLWGTVICFVQLLVLLLSLIPTEIALKNEFDTNGHRRQ